ncbi:MAG: helix-turn-helix domain-containing protein [Fimbriimonadia bacterium]|nr:helix-turn-helix domain-containing protein [Fimbriimonadia bacterium]
MAEKLQILKQQKAIYALLEHPTIRQASKACGVPERTLYRWMNQSEFKDQYDAIRQQVLQFAIGHLQASVPLAIQILSQIACDSNTPANARVRAACALLDAALSLERKDAPMTTCVMKILEIPEETAKML